MLHQAVLEKGLTDPGEILDSTHHGVQEALRQGHNEVNTNDGMDVSIICIDPVRKVKWAGANRPLVIIGTDGKLVKIDGDKFPVGGVQSNHDRQFITHDVPVGDWAMAYMFSDGYADQFGGDRGKKFMVKRFNTLLLEIHKLDPEEQKRRLEENFSDWRKNHEQVDDVLIVGIEI
jgi:serine phosphatase RsbU (regulator of sigma subunit)